jgi:diphthamide synthase (EF-2-diphthine--ammonia ligase)
MLQRQTEAVGLPIETISLPDPCTNEQCDVIMRHFLTESASKRIECMAFGDLFLEDVRKYRENQLKGTGIDAPFPLWGIPTSHLAEQMLSAGLEAYVSSVDLKKVPSRFAGQKWSRDLEKMKEI